MRSTTQILHYAVYAWALVLTLCLPWFLISQRGSSSASCEVHEFHGGSPNGFGAGLGSCQCGRDTYCICTPSLAIDAIVEVNSRHAASPNRDVSILLVTRQDSSKKKYAIPGGFVNVGETVEHAVLREVQEETGLHLDESSVHQYRTVSDPRRDHRRHTVSVVFRCITDTAYDAAAPSGEGGGVVLGTQELRAGDDARAIEVVPLRSVLALDLAFDHKQVLRAFIDEYYPSLPLDAGVE